ncbi:TIGR03086 family metal-binding protein [Kibdelosporangium lantanae]
MDFRDLDRRAMKLASDVVAQVRPEHLSWPTPCADWTLHGLLRHLISENTAFAAATTAGLDPSEVDWNSGRLGPDPIADYERAATTYLDAFVPDTVLKRKMLITGFEVTGSTAVAMHLVDTVAHGWDLAKTLGLDFDIDDELPATALRIMRQFPGDRPTPAFDVVVQVDDRASELDRFVAYVGRRPEWTSPR